MICAYRKSSRTISQSRAKVKRIILTYRNADWAFLWAFLTRLYNFKGVRGSTLSVGKSHAHNIPPRIQSQTDPNQAKPHKDSFPIPVPRPQALRSTRDAWRARGLFSEETAHTPRTTALESEENIKDWAFAFAFDLNPPFFCFSGL